MKTEFGKSFRGSTIIIAAYDSENASGADYVCSGENDEGTINTAINNLPSVGGKIVLLDGTYIIANEITLVSNMILEGQGAANTVIKAMDNATVDMKSIHLNGVSKCILRDFKLDTNPTVQATNSPHGIYAEANSDNNFFENLDITIGEYYTIYLDASDHNTFVNCRVLAAGSSGYLAIVVDVSHYNTFKECYFEPDTDDQMFWIHDSNYLTISNSVFDCSSCTLTVIVEFDNSDYVNFVGNIFISPISNAGYITKTANGAAFFNFSDNLFTINSGGALDINWYDSMITNNIFLSCAEYCIGGTNDRCIITGNYFANCIEGDWGCMQQIGDGNIISDNHLNKVATIRTAVNTGKNNIITANRFFGSVNITEGAIRLQGSGNIVSDNVIDSEAQGSGRWDIQINNICGNQIIAANILRGGTSGYIVMSAGEPFIYGNIGYFTSGLV